MIRHICVRERAGQHLSLTIVEAVDSVVVDVGEYAVKRMRRVSSCGVGIRVSAAARTHLLLVIIICVIVTTTTTTIIVVMYTSFVFTCRVIVISMTFIGVAVTLGL